MRVPPVSSLKRSFRRALICSIDKRTHARRRQFERQRNAVEVDAQLRHRGRMRRRQREVGLMPLRSLDEQLHGLRARPSSSTLAEGSGSDSAGNG